MIVNSFDEFEAEDGPIHEAVHLLHPRDVTTIDVLENVPRSEKHLATRTSSMVTSEKST